MRWVSTRVLPEPGAGDDQQRAAAVDDGVELVGVEGVEFERFWHVGPSVRRGCRGVPLPDRRYRGAPWSAESRPS